MPVEWHGKGADQVSSGWMINGASEEWGGWANSGQLLGTRGPDKLIAHSMLGNNDIR